MIDSNDMKTTRMARKERRPTQTVKILGDYKQYGGKAEHANKPEGLELINDLRTSRIP